MQIDEVISRAAERSIELPAPLVRRAIRIAARVPQADLAAVVGVRVASISRYEAGKRDPRGETRRRYAEALEALRGA